MKRYKYIPGQVPGEYKTIFELITSMSNLKRAYVNASKGKHKYPEVQEIDKDPDKYLKQIQEMLINRTFTTSEYDIFERVEGHKLRKIYKLPFFPDRIVQWAILQIIGPLLERHFIYHSYSSIKGKGPLLCMRNVYKAVHYNTMNARYYLKIDIRKFYPYINHDILKKKYHKLFKDEDLLWLIEDIIDSLPPEEGIPIGNYLSQFSGNLYLTDFDHWVTENLYGVTYYFRYMDDMVIFSDDKIELFNIANKVIRYLYKEEKLIVKPNWQINDIWADGLDFVGYRMFPNHILVRKSIKRNYIKAVKEMMYRRETVHNKSRYYSYKGFIMYANSHNLQKKYGFLLERYWYCKKTRL